MSADPPKNQKGTAAARARDARPTAAAVSGGAGDFFAALGDAWRLTGAQRARLTPAVQASPDMGWVPQALASVIGASTTGVRNPSAVLAARLSPAELPPPAAQPARPPWCGECDQVTRMLDYHGDAPRPCPKCKVPQPRQPDVAVRSISRAFEIRQHRARR